MKFCHKFAFYTKNMSKKTIVLGASPNPGRYSYFATLKLYETGHEVYPIGIRKGKIGEQDIITNIDFNEKVHTVSLYVGAKNQPEWYDLIFRCQPQRIIFNPGTENPELMQLAKGKNIECIEACTLVMLSIREY